MQLTKNKVLPVIKIGLMHRLITLHILLQCEQPFLHRYNIQAIYVRCWFLSEAFIIIIFFF